MQELLTNKTVEKLKHDLVKEGLINFDDLEKAEEIAVAQKINIAQALIRSNIIEEEPLLKFIESKLHIPYVNLDDYTPDEKTLTYINSQDAIKYKIMPLFAIEDVLTIAMADPMDLFLINNLISTADMKIEPIICSEKSILKAINKYYFKSPENISLQEENIDWRTYITNNIQNEDQLQRLIDVILMQAIHEKVHEIFFEHDPGGFCLKFKHNSNIDNKGELPSLLVPLFIAKLKKMSKLNPDISEMPQLGKLIFRLNNIDYVASISAFPTIAGERIALKIYSPPNSFDSLPISADKKEYIKQSINNHGILLICGSELSGKTHIIYSLLSEMAKEKTSIMTVESIVKYNIKEINQCELNENIGFNLDKVIRFIEFQMPDIIYFEAFNTKTTLDYFVHLALQQKTIITEFCANNIESLRKKLSFSEFELFKNLISCLIFVHSKDSIEVFTKNDLEKYL